MEWRLLIGLAVVVAAGSAAAQELYRWTDEKGRVHISDTPPPPGAKNIQKKSAGARGDSPPVPFALAQAMKESPVTLYTFPTCKDPCSQARALLNNRGVPFKEIQVWDDASREELKRVSGGNEVPVIVVGASVHKGFEPTAYDDLLDLARYPKAGVLPARAQGTPPPPQDEVPKPKPEAAKPEAGEGALGPYAPGAPPQRTQRTQKK